MNLLIKCLHSNYGLGLGFEVIIHLQKISFQSLLDRTVY